MDDLRLRYTSVPASMKKPVLALVAFILAVTAVVPMMAGTPVQAVPMVAGRVHERFNPTADKIFVLIIGNDARSGNPDNSLADAIHIAGVDAKTLRGGILNFPRDSYVSIPGYRTAKLNEALYAGGPELLAKTLEQITGIRLDYWVMTGFEGFNNIIDELGGVEMYVDRDLYDPTGSGANIPKGRHNLGDWGALAFVRTRHNYPNGDIDRTTNQGKFLLAMLRKLRRQLVRDPTALLKWIGVIERNTRFDIPPAELFRLAVLTSQVAAQRVGNVTIPVRIGSVGAASVVFIEPAAEAIYRRFEKNGYL